MNPLAAIVGSYQEVSGDAMELSKLNAERQHVYKEMGDCLQKTQLELIVSHFETFRRLAIMSPGRKWKQQ